MSQKDVNNVQDESLKTLMQEQINIKNYFIKSITIKSVDVKSDFYIFTSSQNNESFCIWISRLIDGREDILKHVKSDDTFTLKYVNITQKNKQYNMIIEINGLNFYNPNISLYSAIKYIFKDFW